MTFSAWHGLKRRWLAPEVIQTSATDCGPAAVRCLLEGFGIHASYGRLREACQTTVDGSSIDDIEMVAQQLGLDAEQVVLPRDYLWFPAAEALPSMIVVSQPHGARHFIVLWRRFGAWVQIMDPAKGRRWIRKEHLLRELYLQEVRVSADDWFQWASSPPVVAIFMSRLQALGASTTQATELLKRAQQESHWHSIAALDAGIRMLDRLVAAKALQHGTPALTLLTKLWNSASQESPDECIAIPCGYWSVQPAVQGLDDEAEPLVLRGAVLLRARGRLPSATVCATEIDVAPELQAARNEEPIKPLRELWTLIRSEGVLTPLALLGALGLAVGVLIVEALLFRGFFDLAKDLNVVSQRAIALIALLFFVFLLWGFELPILSESLRLGRHLEMRLRLLLLQKLPRLSDRYLQSRPLSDMAERSHSLYLTRFLPDLVVRILHVGWELLFTLFGIAFLSPHCLPLAIIIAVFAVGVPIVGQSVISERELRVRSHAGALQVFYLDALLGIVPVRTHSAERSVRREHEGLLVEWTRAAKSLLRGSVLLGAIQSFVCLSLASWLLLSDVLAMGVTGSFLLLAYWVLKLPSLGESLTTLALQLPTQRNIALRLLEPINAPETDLDKDPAEGTKPPRQSTTATLKSRRMKRRSWGTAIELQSVEVTAAGHALLQDINLSIAPGEHLAIVGPSGAGKSSLFGLLLGWHTASGGSLLVNGHPLTATRLEELRRTTAWVDPGIQIWNRSLLENLRYNPDPGPYIVFNDIAAQADIAGLLARLPDGLQSGLGEGGACVSGGEGQRIRLARAMWQQQVRLVLLDEPFRGLDRTQRHRHLSAARQAWPDATLICITHDVAETRSFDRVVVIEGGHLVEDGKPDVLAASADSRYRALLTKEDAVQNELWNDHVWRRIRLEGGRVQESARLFLSTKAGIGGD